MLIWQFKHHGTNIMISSPMVAAFTRPVHRRLTSRPWQIAQAVSLLLLLSGCANPLLRQARTDCEPEAHRIFPVVLQSQRVTEPVTAQVPDGGQHCTSESVRQGDRSVTNTRCVPTFTTQTRWVERWVNVDLNAKERGIWLERCAQQLCVERVGNPQCDKDTATTK